MATDVHVPRFQLPEGSKLQRLTEDLPAVPFGTTQYAFKPSASPVSGWLELLEGFLTLGH